jgi:hypothetical protein
MMMEWPFDRKPIKIIIVVCKLEEPAKKNCTFALCNEIFASKNILTWLRGKPFTHIT